MWIRMSKGIRKKVFINLGGGWVKKPMEAK